MTLPASVSEKGAITALSAGTATITATPKPAASSLETARFTLTVSSDLKAESISFPQSEYTLAPDGAIQLEIQAQPTGGDTGELIWSSSNPAVATVEKGKVTALTAGQTTITARNSSGSLTARCTITVTNQASPVSSILLDPTQLTLSVGESGSIKASILPGNISLSRLQWTSSNTQVVTVNTNGRVTAHGVGTAQVSASADGITAVCTVTVTQAQPSQIILNPRVLSLEKGGTYQLEATVTPAGATGTVTYASNDTKVLTVSDTGLVTAVGVGYANVTATTQNGKSYQNTIRVVPQGALPSGPVESLVSPEPPTPQQLFQQTNIQRQANGVSALTYREDLQAQADLRAKELAELFDHTRPDGTSFSTAFAGVSYSTIGENIQMQSASMMNHLAPYPEEVMQVWMDSTTHRSNILNSRYTSIVIGTYQDASGNLYLVQIFLG